MSVNLLSAVLAGVVFPRRPPDCLSRGASLRASRPREPDRPAWALQLALVPLVEALERGVLGLLLAAGGDQAQVEERPRVLLRRLHEQVLELRLHAPVLERHLEALAEVRAAPAPRQRPVARREVAELGQVDPQLAAAVTADLARAGDAIEAARQVAERAHGRVVGTREPEARGLLEVVRVVGVAVRLELRALVHPLVPLVHAGHAAHERHGADG